MKELFRFIASWVAGLLNFNLFLTDDIDSLLLKLRIIELRENANEIQHIYTIQMILEATKCAFMFFSCIMLYLLNQHEFELAVAKFWQPLKRGFCYFKEKIIKIFTIKNKKRL